MDFGKAIEATKNGARISREGWNGKGQYVELATCISYKNASGEIVNADHEAIGNKALAFVGTSGVQIGWLASQADMLADDWVIIGTEKDSEKVVQKKASATELQKPNVMIMIDRKTILQILGNVLSYVPEKSDKTGNTSRPDEIQ